MIKKPCADQSIKSSLIKAWRLASGLPMISSMLDKYQIFYFKL